MNLLNQISIRNNSLRSNDLEKENIIMKKSYEFDEKGLLVKRTSISITFSKRGNYNKIFIYEYNNNGKLIEEKEYKSCDNCDETKNSHYP